MPDKWEYPWYAAWDLAFHSIALSTVDIDFAKEQLDLMLQEFFLHPTGQIPAYEWNFSDVNPPVHAWATMFLYRMEKPASRRRRHGIPQALVHKLMLNFSWWVNRKDRFGRNVLRVDFSGWIISASSIAARRCLRVAIWNRPTAPRGRRCSGRTWRRSRSSLRPTIPFYEEMAVKFADHLLWIAHAMNRTGPGGMWDEEDGFYYDVLRLPDGTAQRLKVRSMVGLLPMCAVSVIEPWQRNEYRARCNSCTNVWSACPNCAKACTHRTDNAARAIAASQRWSIRSGCGASSRACWTRRNFSAHTAFALSPAITRESFTPSRWRGRNNR